MPPFYKKLLISLGVVAVILPLFVVFGVMPFLGEIKNLSKEYLDIQEKIARLNQAGALLEDLEKYYQDKEDNLARIEGAYLGPEEVVGLITTLERIAAQTGNIFEIQSAVPASTGDEKDSYLTLRISLQGDFNSALAFLANLEDNPYPPYRLIEIDDLSIRRTGGQGANAPEELTKNILETSINVKVYTNSPIEDNSL